MNALTHLVRAAGFPPRSPPPLPLISAPFRDLDFSDLPPLQRYSARDRSALGYRSYLTPHAQQSALLIHGSSASSESLHPLASRLRQSGINAYAIDVRGHGISGTRGDTAYVGQLEDYIEDFVASVLGGDRTATLVGFSSGGGFALRFAASDRQTLFRGYLLLAPFLGANAPTTRAATRAWASVSVPRIVAISMLGQLGARRFGHLPVIAFGIDPAAADRLTGAYSFRLWRNFAPHDDYAADFRAAAQPMTLLVGDGDELFDATAYAPLLARVSPMTRVRTVPGAGHITLTTSDVGITAIVGALTR
jgi:alpha-beta hydrolase superfamily lysophospholipase